MSTRSWARALATIVGLLLVLTGLTGPAAAAGNQFIAGSVTITGGSNPAGVTVSAYTSRTAVTPVATATTTSTGSYSLRAPNAATYFVRFSAPGKVTEWWNDAASAALATGVVVKANKTTSGVNAALALTTQSIGGRVVGPAGAPLGGVTVTAYADRTSTTPVVTGTTNPDGLYTLPVPAAGDYVVGFDGPGLVREFFDNAGTQSAAALLVVAWGQVITGKDATLARTVETLTGTVTGPGGPLAGATVAAYAGPAASEPLASTTTGAQGGYQLEVADAGTYLLRISAPGHRTHEVEAEVTWGGTVTTDALLSAVQPGGTIRGRVLDEDGNPVRDAMVIVQAQHVEGIANVSTRTGPDGRYEVADVPPGDVGLLLTRNFPNELRAYNTVGGNQPSPVEVVAGETLVLQDAVLRTAGSTDPRLGTLPGGTIRGTMSGAYSGAYAVVLDDAGTRIGAAQVAADGSYAVGLLKAGVHTVVASTGPDPIDVDLGRSGEVQLADGATADGVDLTMPPTASISGTIRDAAGNPVFGAQVAASTQPNMVSTTTGVDGSYTLRGLVPGDYLLAARGPGLGITYWPSAPTHTEATPLTVAGSQALTGKDITLQGGGVITGLVLDDQGAPVEDALVSASAEGAGQTLAFTDAQGHYTLAGIPTGATYRVFVQHDLYWNTTPAASFEVTGTSPIEAATVQVLRRATLSGVVRDAAGNPVAGQRYEVNGICRGRTTALGAYSCNRVPPHQELALTVYAGQGFDAYSVSVPGGVGAQVTQDVVLSAAPSVSGSVTDLAGQPLAGIPVRITGQQSEPVDTVTAADGSYHLTGVASGYVTVTARSAAYVVGESAFELAAGADRTDVDFTLAPAGQVRVRVENSVTHAPVYGVDVTGFAQDGNCAAACDSSTITDFAGVLLVGSAPLGELRLELGKAGYANGSATVQVLAGSVPEVVVELAPYGEVSGRTVEADGTPVVNLEVSLLGSDGRTYSDYSYGTFRVKELPAGDYALTIRSMPWSEVQYVEHTRQLTLATGEKLALGDIELVRETP